MKKIIHKLRRQKEEDRRHILHISIFFLALLMLVIWSYNLGSTLAKTNIQEDFSELNEFKNNVSDDLKEFNLENNQ